MSSNEGEKSCGHQASHGPAIICEPQVTEAMKERVSIQECETELKRAGLKIIRSDRSIIEFARPDGKVGRLHPIVGGTVFKSHVEDAIKRCLADPSCARCGCYESAHGEGGRCEPVGWTFLAARPTDEAARIPEGVEKWSLTFYGSPPAVTLWAGPEGLPDSRRELAHLQFPDMATRAQVGGVLRSIVKLHNAALSAPVSLSDDVVERIMDAIRAEEPLREGISLTYGQVERGLRKALAAVTLEGGRPE